MVSAISTGGVQYSNPDQFIVPIAEENTVFVHSLCGSLRPPEANVENIRLLIVIEPHLRGRKLPDLSCQGKSA